MPTSTSSSTSRLSLKSKVNDNANEKNVEGYRSCPMGMSTQPSEYDTYGQRHPTTSTNFNTFNEFSDPSAASPSHHHHQHNQSQSHHQSQSGSASKLKHLDFIAPSNAVKDLFAMPYNNDAGVAVAVHNIGDGTLLLDGAVIRLDDYVNNNASANTAATNVNNANNNHDYNYAMDNRQTTKPSDSSSINDNNNKNNNNDNNSKTEHTENKNNDTNNNLNMNIDDKGLLIPSPSNCGAPKDIASFPSLNQQMISLACTTGSTKDWTTLQQTLSSLHSNTDTDPPSSYTTSSFESFDDATRQQQQQQQQQQHEMTHILPKPDHYTRSIVTSPKAPREFLQWRFRDYNLLVGSDAFVLRTGTGNDTTTNNNKNNSDNDNDNNNINNNSNNSNNTETDISGAVDTEQHKNQRPPRRAQELTTSDDYDRNSCGMRHEGQEQRLQQIQVDDNDKSSILPHMSNSHCSTATDTNQKSSLYQQQQHQHHQQHQYPKQEKHTGMSQALTIRIVDSDLCTRLRRHEEMTESANSYYHPHQSQSQHVSYADAVSSTTNARVTKQKQSIPSRALFGNEIFGNGIEMEDGANVGDINGDSGDGDGDGNNQEDHIGLDTVSLQTCVIPSTQLQSHLRQYGFCATPYCKHANNDCDKPSGASISSSSPVCTALDAYLDNIMANVPQLALCLQEKGFFQSIRLLRTEDIPSLSSSDLEGVSSSSSSSSSSPGGKPKPLFSPTVVESNAAMLLQFLKSNCTRENCTYLLRRNAGETNIELFDITSVSGQRQRKWIWWLAMISYRFALRLDQLARNVAKGGDEATARNFRSRQRSLLHNSLELIQDLADMDGGNHETMSAAVSELLADTYLWSNNDNTEHEDSPNKGGSTKTPSTQEQTCISSCSSSSSSTTCTHPYNNVNVDGLTKAQDNLVNGIMVLKPALKEAERRSSECEGSDDNESDEGVGQSIEIHAIAMQMYGLHHKLINVSLRLTEQHLQNYSSSSAMQTLRTAGRKIADESKILEKLDQSDISVKAFINSISNQYAWVWECCGNFARSFAADEMWRERGHTSGDDVISLLQDVEVASSYVRKNVLSKLENNGTQQGLGGKRNEDFLSLTEKTKGVLNLNVLSGIVPILDDGTIDISQKPDSAIDVANSILDKQKQMKRDERRVLVAATISYSNAAAIAMQLVERDNITDKPNMNSMDPKNHGTCTETVRYPISSDVSILSMLRQRFGDACNEIGKILLTVVKELIKSGGDMTPITQMLLSSEFWFSEGLQSFEKSYGGGMKNISLLNIALMRCNLCQCCKIRANSNLDLPRKPLIGSSGSFGSGLDSRVELCLQDAAKHLELAHEALGQRELHPKTWDMVSEELAATFLILGVRRRQSLIGSTPVVTQSLRLNPGRERYIIEPMQRAKIVYESLHNGPQAAAADYQMALFYSKVWTCQRDETKTREKLSLAFSHFSTAHRYFFAQMRSCEPTFIILCLDLSNLYSAVSAQGCLQKALLCCVDTCDAFSPEAVYDAKLRQSQSQIKRQRRKPCAEDDWMEKMKTLASSVEKRIFKLLPNLVKIEKADEGSSSSKFMDLYRALLTMKVHSTNKEDLDEHHIFTVHDLLLRLRREDLSS